MEKLRYWRALPDGSKQVFRDRLERPDADQKYFDDVISHSPSAEDGAPLNFLHFGREQSYPHRVLKRATEDYILHYVTEGKGIFNGRTIRAGEGFLTVPGVPHHMESDSKDPWHFKWIAFAGSGARLQMKSIGLDERNLYFHFGFADRLEELFDDVLYREHGDCDINVYMQGIFYIIMSYHRKEYLTDSGRGERGEGYAREAIRYMDVHYRENLRTEEIAKRLHISRKYLCTVLENAVGMSTKDYLLRRRIEVAAELLLRTDMTVSEIAAEVGYGDYTQLSRLFREKKGVSPQQFRKRARESAGMNAQGDGIDYYTEAKTKKANEERREDESNETKKTGAAVSGGKF